MHCRVLTCDFDGTGAVDGRLAPEVAEALRRLGIAVSRVPIGSLRHHMLAGDFSRWGRDVLGDEALAAGLAKLEHTARASGRPSPAEVLQHVRDRYAPAAART
jgi:hypothetical protein